MTTEERWRKFEEDSSGKATMSVVMVVSVSLGSRFRAKLTEDGSGAKVTAAVDIE